MSDKSVVEPPHSEEAEQAVLGGLMLDRAAWLDVGDVLVPEYFYRNDHRLIFESIAKLADANEACDPVTVSDDLSKRGVLADVGGLQYLGTLTRDTPGAANVRSYANIVKERANRRFLIICGRELVALGHLGFEREELDLAQQQVLDITTEKVKQGFRRAHDAFASHVDEITARGDRKSHLVGPSTGFPAIDQVTLGLEPGTLLLVAARPSVGKTALVCAILDNLTLRQGEAAALFSLEMPESQLLDRLIASEGRIPLQNIRSGQLGDDEWVRLTEVGKKIYAAQLHIDDTAGISIGEIRARARRLKHRLQTEGKKLVCIAVDYLQLVRGIGSNANERVGSVSAGLKNLAKELGLCVIALSQLTREVEKREGGRPQMSDLRDSGSLEQDADVILFIWKKEGPEQGVRMWWVDKNRNGATGGGVIAFDGKYTRFEPMDSQREMDWFRDDEEKRKPKKAARSPEDSPADKRAGTDK